MKYFLIATFIIIFQPVIAPLSAEVKDFEYLGVERKAEIDKRLTLFGVNVSWVRVFGERKILERIQMKLGYSNSPVFDATCVSILLSDEENLKLSNQADLIPFMPSLEKRENTVYIYISPQDFIDFMNTVNIETMERSISVIGAYREPSAQGSYGNKPDELGSPGNKPDELGAESICKNESVCYSRGGAEDGGDTVSATYSCGPVTFTINSEGDFQPGLKTRYGSFSLP